MIDALRDRTLLDKAQEIRGTALRLAIDLYYFVMHKQIRDKHFNARQTRTKNHALRCGDFHAFAVEIESGLNLFDLWPTRCIAQSDVFHLGGNLEDTLPIIDEWKAIKGAFDLDPHIIGTTFQHCLFEPQIGIVPHHARNILVSRRTVTARQRTSQIEMAGTIGGRLINSFDAAA